MKKEKILYWPGRGQSLDILKSFREEFEKINLNLSTLMLIMTLES